MNIPISRELKRQIQPECAGALERLSKVLGRSVKSRRRWAFDHVVYLRRIWRKVAIPGSGYGADLSDAELDRVQSWAREESARRRALAGAS